MPYYMANAREHFDNGSVTYGNPFSPSYTTPAISSQPLTLVLGVLWKLTGADPGVVFVSIGAVAALFCVRAAVALYSEVAGLETRSAQLGVVAFVWGGGLLALAGLAASLYTGRGELFRFDPHQGYWFLNFGRTMISSDRGRLSRALFRVDRLHLAEAVCPGARVCLRPLALVIHLRGSSCSHILASVVIHRDLLHGAQGARMVVRCGVW